jgi:hypothetical protein
VSTWRDHTWGRWVHHRLRVLLAEFLKHHVDSLKSQLDVISSFGSGENDLPGGKDQKDDFGFNHAINQPRKEFGLIGAELLMAVAQVLERYRELDIARTDNVLYLEILQLDVVASHLFDHFRILFGRVPRLILAFGSGDDHFARGEDEGSGLGVTDANDHGRETFGVVFSIPAVQGDVSEVQGCPQIGCGHDVLKFWLRDIGLWGHWLGGPWD